MGSQVSDRKPHFQEIIPSALYICAGDEVTPENINHNGITHIVNCTYSLPLYKKNGFTNCIRYALADRSSQDILQYFCRFYEYAKEAYAADGKARILVHCKMGASRSVAMILSLLMKYHGMPLKNAFEFMLKKRACICPNVGFWRQLIEWDELCFGQASVKMIQYRSIPEMPDIVLRQSQRYVIFVSMNFTHVQRRSKTKEKKVDEEDPEEKKDIEASFIVNSVPEKNQEEHSKEVS